MSFHLTPQEQLEVAQEAVKEVAAKPVPLLVSFELLLQIEGARALDEYGRLLTWNSRVVDGQVEATVTYGHPSLRERLLWALRPKRPPIYIR